MNGMGRGLLLALGLAMVVLVAAGFALRPPEVEFTRFFPVVHAPLFLLYLLACALVFKKPGNSPRLVLAVAVGLRVLAATEPPALSSDIYRYAWDGRVQRAAINPYAFPPEASELAPLADDAIHPHINRPWATTVYPPVGQVLYRLLPYDVDAIRAVMIAFDLLTMLLLAALLSRDGLDPARVVVYAWCPLVVYEVGNNGHLEAAVLPALLGMVLALRAGHKGLAGLLLGVATGLKLYPGLALLAVWRRGGVRLVAAMIGLLAALYLLYGWSVGPRVLGFLPQYVGVAEDHNVGLRHLVEWLLPAAVPQPRAVAFALCVGLLVLGSAWIARRGAPRRRS